MAQQGQIGGSRDIMAQRMACTNSAASFDDTHAGYTALCEAYDGYTQTDFEAMGNTEDDAYYLADRLPKIKAILESSPDWQEIQEFAAKTRDISRP
jgi:hypothetical protein